MQRKLINYSDAGWSSLVARRPHNPKVVGSNPAPATKRNPFYRTDIKGFFVFGTIEWLMLKKRPMGQIMSQWRPKKLAHLNLIKQL